MKFLKLALRNKKLVLTGCAVAFLPLLLLMNMSGGDKASQSLISFILFAFSGLTVLTTALILRQDFEYKLGNELGSSELSRRIFELMRWAKEDARALDDNCIVSSSLDNRFLSVRWPNDNFSITMENSLTQAIEFSISSRDNPSLVVRREFSQLSDENKKTLTDAVNDACVRLVLSRDEKKKESLPFTPKMNFSTSDSARQLMLGEQLDFKQKLAQKNNEDKKN